MLFCGFAAPRLAPGELGNLTAEVGGLRSSHLQLQGRVTELERERERLAKKLETDFGPGGAFALMTDKCFETKVGARTIVDGLHSALWDWAALPLLRVCCCG